MAGIRPSCGICATCLAFSIASIIQGRCQQPVIHSLGFKETDIDRNIIYLRKFHALFDLLVRIQVSS